MNYSYIDTTKSKNDELHYKLINTTKSKNDELYYKLINDRIKQNFFILLKNYVYFQKKNKNKDEKKNIKSTNLNIKCYYCGHDKLKSMYRRGGSTRWYYLKKCIKCNKCYDYRYLLTQKDK